MSDEFDGMFDDDEFTTDEPEGGSQGSQLRQYLKQLKARNQELERREADRVTAERSSSLAAALSGAGKDPAAVGLIPADVGPDGVAKWLETNGAFIKDVEAEDQPAVETAPEPVLSPDEQAAQAAVSGAPSGGPTSAVSSADSATLDALRQAESEADFYAALQEAQDKLA